MQKWYHKWKIPQLTSCDRSSQNRHAKNIIWKCLHALSIRCVRDIHEVCAQTQAPSLRYLLYRGFFGGFCFGFKIPNVSVAKQLWYRMLSFYRGWAWSSHPEINLWWIYFLNKPSLLHAKIKELVHVMVPWLLYWIKKRMVIYSKDSSWPPESQWLPSFVL